MQVERKEMGVKNVGTRRYNIIWTVLTLRTNTRTHTLQQNDIIYRTRRHYEVYTLHNITHEYIHNNYIDHFRVKNETATRFYVMSFNRMK